MSRKPKERKERLGLELVLWCLGVAAFALLIPYLGNIWFAARIRIPVGTDGRCSAALRLAKAGKADGILFLCDALVKGNCRSRPEVAKWLGQIGDTRGTDALVNILNDEDGTLRSAAAAALGQIGDRRAVEPLLRSLASWENGARADHDAYARAAIALANLSETNSAQRLVRIIRNSDGWYTSQYYRTDALNALLLVSKGKAIELLDEYLSHPLEKTFALEIIEKTGWTPSNSTQRVRLNIARQDRAALFREWEQVKSVLFGDLRSDSHMKQQSAASTFLAMARAEVIPEMIDYLGHYGTPGIAQVYANSGNPKLENAARQWALKNGYMFTPNQSHSGPQKWGEF